MNLLIETCLEELAQVEKLVIFSDLMVTFCPRKSSATEDEDAEIDSEDIEDIKDTEAEHMEVEGTDVEDMDVEGMEVEDMDVEGTEVEEIENTAITDATMEIEEIEGGEVLKQAA
ncbi:hypothetical protein EW146_g6812 [Bondarzewia mesenterica]|uniref:Uncharacterized protein n=1 Tax=Bondarzewia mesenterica TaxID=1095465 RepID=A0A4S4LPC0_9AGAM|nr:hypothetical protein EW146_g6812 [Bondarzewia mesenterica]